MKKLYVLVFLFFSSMLFSQTLKYGNEWINHSQQYYKIQTTANGVYKLDSAQLASSGIPLVSIDPRNFQFFHKGKELSIFIKGEGDGQFNSNDYILFYAEKNTCVDDSLLFEGNPFLANPYSSVISDSSAVFITWNSSTSNARFVLQNDTTFSTYVPSPYYIKNEVKTVNTAYHLGAQNIIGATDPRYLHGEGMYSDLITIGQSKAYSFNTSSLYAAGPQSWIAVSYSGASRSSTYVPDRDIEIAFKDNINNWIALDFSTFYGFRTLRPTYFLANNQMGTSTDVRLTSVNNPSYYNGNRTVIHYAQLVFPSTFDLNNATSQLMNIPDDASQAKSLLNITNFPSATPVWLFDLTNNKIDTVVGSGSSYKALVTNSGGFKKCFIASESSFIPIIKITPVNGSGFFVNYLNQSVDSAYVIISNKKFINGVGLPQYAAYRSSVNGGAHNVITADVDDLYDQFAFGVNHHSLGLRNFCHFLIDTFPTAPKNLFLIGKAVHAASARLNNLYYSRSLVPSIGNPASDNMITAKLPGSIYLDPAIPTGRLAAQTDSDVVNYFNKVVLYESQPDGIWKKDIIHFVGGIDAAQQTTFNQYMQGYKNTIEDTLYGGNVYSFYKTSTQPIGINTNDSIKELIEAGVSLLTFFGHGSYTGFEQNIDNPYAFNNSPRFPMMIANSCYTGDIHTEQPGIYSNSEKFVLAEDHGTIGFLASVSSGVSYALNYYNNELYKEIASKSYGASYGEIIKATIVNTLSQFVTLTDSIVNITCLEMTLHGDPAIKAVSFASPDYSITNPDVAFDIVTDVDSVAISIGMYNLARAINDSFNVYVERVFPNGDTAIYLKRVRAPLYQSTLNFKVDKEIINAVGLNKFYVHLDHFSEITEVSELNNATSGYVNLFIPGGDIVPVYPYKFAIVPRIDSVGLKASTADPFAPMQNYRLQVDTNDSFNSPLINTIVSSVGGLITWNVALLNTDSTVYFWRVAKDTSNPLAYNWRESSFQVINGKRGWAQAHFNQYKDDSYQYVKYNKALKQFDFANDVKTLAVRDAYNTAFLDFALIGYSINNVQQNYWTCGGGGGGWTFAVFDSVSGAPWIGDTALIFGGTWLSQFGSCVCTPELRPAFDFGEANYCGDPAYWRAKMESFLAAIPNGKYVLAYSHANDSSTFWPPSLINQFQSIGSASIQTKADTVAMIVWGKKGAAPGFAKEVIGANKSSIVELADTLTTNWNSGYIATDVIGPASAWGSFHWRQNTLELPNKDSVYVKLIGITNTGQKVSLYDFKDFEKDIPDLYNYVDVNIYSKIQLVAYMRDDSFHTPPQMEHWQVIYTPVPEAALQPNLGFSVNKTTLQEGDVISIKMPIKNISDVPFSDSLVVTYWIEDANKINNPLPDKLKGKPFLPDSVFMDTIVVNTAGFPGANAIWIDVNPLSSLKYQAEQYHFNNIARIEFNVNRDVLNPLLDVTFDGIHILNGDIVSSKPNILVSLKDENKFLALNDTSDFSFYLKYPGAVTETRIFFNNNLVFTPAQLPNNSCKILFNPSNLSDGKYEIIVQAKDRSDNESGAINYRLQFEVINKATITEVLNYPNPFSTSTRFVFTLTGNEIPETFKIQILTITGKVVKEIHKDELGFIHIGRNVTEYAWNGKDEFGDQLANGVYLYRVVTRLNGSTIERRESGADSYITKGFGKLVIMR